MAWFAASRLTLTKSQAEEKPVVEAGEPFPDLSYYTEDDMLRLEAEGFVYRAPAAKADAKPQAESDKKPS